MMSQTTVLDLTTSIMFLSFFPFFFLTNYKILLFENCMGYGLLLFTLGKMLALLLYSENRKKTPKT